MADLTNSNGEILVFEKDRVKTEVWTRVMGYHRPVSEFNPGKKSEHAERLPFKECPSEYLEHQINKRRRSHGN
jgi:hypothetical protein